MDDFWEFVGWALLGVFCFVLTLVAVYFAFENLMGGSLGTAIFLFIVATVLAVCGIAAFRQIKSNSK